MENVTNFKKIVREVIEEVAGMIPKDTPIEVQNIFDEERGHYLLYMVGWDKHKRDYASVIHIDVKQSGKVYVQHDGTDLKIALLLAEKGIPKSSIVIGYRSPFVRQQLTDFALE